MKFSAEFDTQNLLPWPAWEARSHVMCLFHEQLRNGLLKKRLDFMANYPGDRNSDDYQTKIRDYQRDEDLSIRILAAIRFEV